MTCWVGVQMSKLDIETLLTRSEISLSTFLGKPVMDVLKILDADAVHPQYLTKLIEKSIPAQMILQDTKTRNILINAMKDTEAEDFARFIGIKNWENVHYKLLHARLKKPHIKKALEFFDKDYNDELTIIREDVEEIDPKSLFPHQVVTVKKINEYLAEPPHKALLHMPTGSGKTISAMRVILVHLLENPEALIVWLAHNEELCEQAINSFQQMWKKAGDRKINMYRFYGRSKLNPLKIKSGFMVASLSKMLGSAKKSNLFLAEMAKSTNFVVIDEAHQSTADKFSKIISELAVNKETKLLGLSATPGRQSNVMAWANMDLAQFFAERKVMLDTGKENPVVFLIKNGYLAQPKFNSILYDKNELSDMEIKRIEKDMDIPSFILEKLSIDTMRNLTIIREIIRLSQFHKKIIVFASNINHARTLSLILTAKGYSSYYITTNTPRGIRLEILNKYKSTEKSMILCNYGILTTGFDAPKTSAVVIARPTKSHVLYAQMVGRGIRGPKAGGNATCEISTIKDAKIDDFINVVDIFTQWEKAWNDDQ